MALIRGLVKGVIAKKLYDLARRPENQAKARELFRQATSKGSSRQGPRRQPR